MGHSDIETTRQYLNPNDELKKKAADRLSLSCGTAKMYIYKDGKRQNADTMCLPIINCCFWFLRINNSRRTTEGR